MILKKILNKWKLKEKNCQYEKNQDSVTFLEFIHWAYILYSIYLSALQTSLKQGCKYI